jgi:hypothetical protein
MLNDGLLLVGESLVKLKMFGSVVGVSRMS